MDKPFIFFTPMDKLIWTGFWLLCLAAVIGICVAILFIGFYCEKAKTKVKVWRAKRKIIRQGTNDSEFWNDEGTHKIADSLRGDHGHD
jgi:nitric oxide reductase large subunit